MRRLLFLFLRAIGAIQKFFLRIKGKTEEDVHNQRITSGQVLVRILRRIKSRRERTYYRRGLPWIPFSRLKVCRYLSRLTRAGLEAYVEYPDPSFPRLRRMVHETIKMGADNPDNYYMNAQISGAYEYKIMGKRNTIDHISFHTQNGNYGSTGGLAPCGKIDNSDLVLEKDGSFEIFVTREPQGKNWLKIEEETTLLMVRQTFCRPIQRSSG